MVHDTEFLKHVFAKKGANFMDRRNFAGKGPRAAKMMPVLEGDDWRVLRNTISPTFSTGKIRLMIRQMNECAQGLVDHLAQEAESGNHFECKEYTGAFTMDVIAKTAFGLNIDSQKDKNSMFVKMAKQGLQLDVFNPFMFITFFLPCLVNTVNYFGFDNFPKGPNEFFTDIATKTFEARRESYEETVDFLQLMVNAHKEKDDGDVDNESHQSNGATRRRELTKDEIVAQSLVFFIAGYETTALTISYLMYLLAVNPDIQEKLHEEIITVAGDKEIDYDMLHQMNLLDMCCQETLRLYPAGMRLNRQCSNSTNLNGIDIPKGTLLQIPVYAIHHDPEIWPEPEKFNPYRVIPEEKAKHSPYDWLPFGSGPRNCIGMRLALSELKVSTCYILRHYRLLRGSKTEVPLTLKKSRLLQPKNGIWIKIEKR